MDFQEILAVRGSTLYIRALDGTILMYDTERRAMEITGKVSGQLGKLWSVDTAMYDVTDNVLTRFSKDLRTELYSIELEQQPIGIVRERENKTCFVTSTGIYELNRETDEVTQLVHIDEVFRYDQVGNTGCLFTELHRLIVLDVQTLTTRILGETIRVTPVSHIAFSDDYLAVGNFDVAGNVVEYWNLKTESKVETESHIATRLPLAIIDNVIWGTTQRHTVHFTSFVKTIIEGESIRSEMIDALPFPYDYTTAEDVAVVNDKVFAVGGGHLIVEMQTTSLEPNVYSLLVPFGGSIEFDSPNSGWASGASGSLSRTSDGGFTWQPLEYNIEEQYSLGTSELVYLQHLNNDSMAMFTRRELIPISSDFRTDSIDYLLGYNIVSVIPESNTSVTVADETFTRTTRVLRVEDGVHREVLLHLEKEDDASPVWARTIQDTIEVVFNIEVGEEQYVRMDKFVHETQVESQVLHADVSASFLFSDSTELVYSIQDSTGGLTVVVKPHREFVTEQYESPFVDTWVSAVKLHEKKLYVSDIQNRVFVVFDRNSKEVKMKGWPEYLPGNSDFTVVGDTLFYFRTSNGVFRVSEDEFSDLPVSVNDTGTFDKNEIVLLGRQQHGDYTEFTVEAKANVHSIDASLYTYAGKRCSPVDIEVVAISQQIFSIRVATNSMPVGYKVLVISSDNSSVIHVPMQVIR